MANVLIIVFTDIRGFTRWSEGIEAFEYIDEFIGDFYKILNKHFSDTDIKKLGDGAMIVEKIEKEIPNELLKEMLLEYLNKIRDVNTEFNTLCNNFSETRGYATKLRLGWALVRGVAKEINDDFIGANINRCARLCDIARPFE